MPVDYTRRTFRYALGQTMMLKSGQTVRIIERWKSYDAPYPYTVQAAGGDTYPVREDELRLVPVVGMGVTIPLVTDTWAAVVTGVTAKTITVALVETGQPEPDMASDAGAWGVRPTHETGILDRPIPGTERRFTFRRGAWRNGGEVAVLGRSVTRRDWRV